MSKFLIVTALLLGGGAIAPRDAHAQALPDIPRFAHVRVHLLDRTVVTGELDTLGTAGVVLGASPFAPQHRIPLDSVVAIDVRHRVSFAKRAGETTLLGVMVGAAAGVGINFLMGSPDGGGRGLGRMGPLLIGAIGGGMAATALGAGERWTEAYRHAP
jgi:hypothetical protein